MMKLEKQQASMYAEDRDKKNLHQRIHNIEKALGDLDVGKFEAQTTQRKTNRKSGKFHDA